MKKIVKPLFFAVLAISLQHHAIAQKSVVSAGAFESDIKKIIRDYPHQFTHLQGNVVNENPQSIDYDCNVVVDGSEASSITRYSSGKKSIYSWQATMLTTDDFEEAAKKYKALFSQFNHMGVRMDYGDTFFLSGKYAGAEEQKTFASSILTFEKADALTRKMKLEISLQYEMLEWKVKVIIYEKDREDNERGETEE